MTSGPSPGLSTGRASMAVAAAMSLTNLCTYAYTMVVARLLGPQDYGAFAALMGLLLVLGVAQLGLQATAARRISAEPAEADEVERAVLGLGWRVAAGIGVLGLVAAPAVTAVLRLDSWMTALLVPLAAAPITITGAQLGVLQGRRRWGPLALLYLANGLPRLAIGVALVLVDPSETTALLGVAVGQLVPVVLGTWLLRADPAPAGRHQSGTLLRRRLGTELLHNSHVLLAFFLLWNVDVLVARNGFTGHSAGLYAAGLIVTKAVLFLPQFVVVLAFPSMADQAHPGRTLYRALAVVGGLGLLATVVAFLLGDLALVFVGGAEYDDVAGVLWLFALIGTALGVLQMLSYAVVARQSRLAVFWIWAALAVVVLAGQAVDTPTALATVVLGVDVLLALVLLATVAGRQDAGSRARDVAIPGTAP